MTDKIEVPRELLEELRDCAAECANHEMNRGRVAREGRVEGYRDTVDAVDELLREAAKPKCWCEACRPVTFEDMRMPLCPVCGNKRCPRSLDHRNACNNSNEPNQSAAPCCNNPAQCWEPCGDLGKSAEHAQSDNPIPSAPEAEPLAGKPIRKKAGTSAELADALNLLLK